ncbi:hypothetical protein PSN45_000777 [Yamadazyma tenuis]|nr:hypothetical protein PSN45_000777 [Yamadazyma tenuis]
MTTGEGEINASNSMMALLLNPQFDLSRTYFLLNGIGGGEPSRVTTGSVTFAKYAIQVGLMYQIDSRELPVAYKDWPSGYFSYGAKDPFTYPDAVYGTEIYELNEHLRDRAIRAAKKNEASLQSGTPQNILLRNMYDGPGGEPPTVMACDVTTSDNYFFGHRMSDFFMDYTSMVTNNTAYYCSSAQEENGTLESLLRMAKSHRVSFDRIIVMRSISNFVKPPPSVDDSVDFFNNFNKGGFQLALDNLFLGGYPVVEDIVENWDEVYAEGVKCSNYVGDIFGSLGGTPNFGKHNYTIH